MTADYLAMAAAYIAAEDRRAYDSPADPVAFAARRPARKGSLHEWAVSTDAGWLRFYLTDRQGVVAVYHEFSFGELIRSDCPRELVTQGILRARQRMKYMKNENTKPL